MHDSGSCTTVSSDMASPDSSDHHALQPWAERPFASAASPSPLPSSTDHFEFRSSAQFQNLSSAHFQNHSHQQFNSSIQQDYCYCRHPSGCPGHDPNEIIPNDSANPKRAARSKSERRLVSPHAAPARRALLHEFYRLRASSETQPNRRALEKIGFTQARYLRRIGLSDGLERLEHVCRTTATVARQGVQLERKGMPIAEVIQFVVQGGSQLRAYDGRSRGCYTCNHQLGS